MRRLVLLVLLIASPLRAEPINWASWSPDIFTRAQTDRRLVLLDLEAVWCHWCHVMDKETYANPKVRALLASRYIAVKVDQDSRPDLSHRYEDYGWPATIIFDSAGHELAKRRGYIEPAEMIALLEKLAANPVPESDAEETVTRSAPSPLLPSALVAELKTRDADRYDEKLGGWGTIHKLLHGDPEEWALSDAEQKAIVQRTLHEALVLIDPVWGGAFQYSVHTWHEPHFEKIASIQARYLSLYSLACAQSGKPEYLKAAQAVSKYIATFLTSPDGALWTSQDADVVRGRSSAGYFALDDAHRRKRGVPIVDKHLYARENGEMAAALAFFGAATGDSEAIARARRAVAWVQTHRRAPGGGFHHGENDPEGTFYLGDTLEMGIAFLRLYEVTADRSWLPSAESAAKFIADHFASPAGFVTSTSAEPAGLQARPETEENIRLVRFANLLSHYTGNDQWKSLAETAMRYLAVPEVARDDSPAGVLLAANELGKPPLHITIVGPKDDPTARQLFATALRTPSGYRRIEWWDRREGPMPNADVAYPELKQPAAYLCTEKSCSLPLRDSDRLRAALARAGYAIP